LESHHIWQFKPNASCTDNCIVSVHKPIVVVIDDDPDFVEFVASIIEGENCRSVVATDGLTGLLLAREVRAKLVLCDYMMPGFDGTQVMQALREDPAMADVPRVLMSGHGCPDLRAIPADAFIAKPIDTQSLRKLVRAFTRQRNTRVAEAQP
jgi:CheY-like chemotaxis protein